MKTCPSCKESYEDDKNFCRKCGTQLSVLADKPISPRQAFEDQIAKEPNVAEHFTSYGDFLLSESLIDDAISQYLQGLKISPNDGIIGLKLIKALNSRELYDKAIAHASKLITSHPDNVPLLDELASAYIGLGRLTEAAEILLRLINLEPSSTDLYVRTLNVLRNIHDRQGILKTCYALHKIKPYYYPVCNFYLGSHIAASSHDDDMEQLSKAERLLDAAISRSDGLSAEELISCKLFLISTQLKLKKDVSIWLDYLHTISPQSLSSDQKTQLADCCYFLGRAQLKAGLVDDAIKSFSRSVEISATDRAQSELAKAHQLKDENAIKTATDQVVIETAKTGVDSGTKELSDDMTRRNIERFLKSNGVFYTVLLILILSVVMAGIERFKGGGTTSTKATTQPPTTQPPSSQQPPGAQGGNENYNITTVKNVITNRIMYGQVNLQVKDIQFSYIRKVNLTAADRANGVDAAYCMHVDWIERYPGGQWLDMHNTVYVEMKGGIGKEFIPAPMSCM